MNLITLKDLAETLKFGEWIGQHLVAGDVVAMDGPLGVGKTTMVQGLARGLKVEPGYQVTSPTFVYMQIYQGPIPLYHMDLYRIESQDQLVTSGLMDSVGEEGVSVIEWYDRFPHIWDEPCLKLSLSFASDGGREVKIEAMGDRAQKMLTEWDKQA